MTAPRTALVLGGNSDIALATLRRLASDGLDRVVLAARDIDALERRLEAEPLSIAEVTIVAWDTLDAAGHGPLIDTAAEELGGIDLVICAVGSLGHGAGITATSASANALIESNFSGPAAVLTDVAHHLVERGRGTIVVLSSVAALRPRRSNYLYGSAKAGLDSFALGLADAVAGSGVQVHVIRPGFVTSKMTTGLRPAPFASTPEAVAEAIADAMTSAKSRIVHVPRVLGPLFAVLRLTPRAIWRRIAGDR
ncbi:MAG: short chain dehydrogenase/reductase family oxidoreductase [Acidimicrobiales bacterium]|nr:short chain dehydrogenase/reductase family oxidoreductase [Acidimicrobiales bacterium]